MASRLLKVKGTDLYYVDHNEIERLLAGEAIAGSFSGKLKVKGTYLHYMDNNGSQRRLLGTLTGNTGTAGRLKIKAACIRYIDNNGDEREIPIAFKFYPTIGGEGVAADGIAYRLSYNETWAAIRAGAGTHSLDTGPDDGVVIRSSTEAFKWDLLRRSPLHLDTTEYLGGTIASAKVYVNINFKLDNLGIEPSLALVESLDPNPGSIVNADYQVLQSTPLAPAKTWGELISPGWNVFTIDPAYYNKIISGGVTRFGFREYKYDCLGATPAWSSYASILIRWYSRDNPAAWSYPYLEITYS